MEIPWENPPPPYNYNTFSTPKDPPLTPCIQIPKNKDEKQPILTENLSSPFDHFHDDFSKLLNDERSKMMNDLSQSFQDFIMNNFPPSKPMQTSPVPHTSEPTPALPPKHLDILTPPFPYVKTEFPIPPSHQYIPKLIVDSTPSRVLIVSMAEVVKLTLTLENPTMATDPAAATQKLQLAEGKYIVQRHHPHHKGPKNTQRTTTLYHRQSLTF